MINETQAIERRGWIGASDLARDVTGKFGGTNAVLMSKRGGIERSEEENSHVIDLGNAAEPYGLDWFEREQNCKLARNVRVVHKREGSPIACNLDGQMEDGTPVEHKLIFPWSEREWTDEGNAYTICQIHAQMMCCETDKGFVVAWFVSTGRKIIEVPRNEKLCDALWQRALWLKEMCLSESMPSMTFDGIPEQGSHEQVRDALNATTIAKGEIATLDERDLETVKLWEVAKKAATSFGNGAEALRDWLLMRIGEAEIGSLPDGTNLKRRLVKRKGFVVEPGEYVELKRSKGGSDE